MITKEIRHFHFCCGIGGAAKGFNKANPRVGNMQGKFRCIGGVDVDASAIRDFGRIAGVPGTAMDLFTRGQYVAFHDKEPPAGWREMGPADIRRAAGNERPHVVFISSPCKGASGLLSEKMSKTAKYQALNELTLRCIWLMSEAWKDDPVDLIVFENVPRLATRARHLLDQINQVLRSYGYAVAETTHDCGELGGLAQSRKRFLLVARHMEKVPAFLYEPEKKRLRPVGDVLGRMPMPGDARGGPMHRIPRLQWKTWVRLAFVEAGSDWRSLNKLTVANGHLQDYLIVPEYREHYLGVNRWEEPVGTVSGRSSPSNGAYSVSDPRAFSTREGTGHLGVNKWDEPMGVVTANGRPGSGNFSIADPRFDQSAKWNDGQAYGVRRWDEASGAIAGQQSPGQGAYSVADPRGYGGETHKNVYRIVKWSESAGTVTAGHGPSSGGGCVADPRPGWNRHGGNLSVMDWDKPANVVIAGGKGVQGGWMSVADPRTGKETHSAFGVTPWDAHAGTVAGESFPSNGAFAVADPRTGLARVKGDNYLTAGQYGVIPWESTSGAVSAAAGHDSGRWSVADPRIDTLPALNEKTIAIIRSLDGTWHRPFTTLELAALQSLIDPDEHWSIDPQVQAEIDDSKRSSLTFYLDGNSDSVWREHIGNLVPPDAAEAIGGVIGTTLILAANGETFTLSRIPVWVRPVAIAISVAQGEPS